jgi:DNA-directed RNA polymerase specialized sigma24 family protein
VKAHRIENEKASGVIELLRRAFSRQPRRLQESARRRGVEPDDIAHTILMRSLNKSHGLCVFTGPDGQRNAYVAVHSALCNEARAGSRRPSGGDPDRVPGSWVTPVDVVLAKEMAARINTAQRGRLLMGRTSGRTLKAIAQDEGVSVSAIWHRIQRERKRIAFEMRQLPLFSERKHLVSGEEQMRGWQ